MRSSRLAACGILAVLTIVTLHRFVGGAVTSLGGAAVWGGKMEHCAIAIGMIGGAILGMFANPVCGPLALGLVTAGLVWMLSCT